MYVLTAAVERVRRRGFLDALRREPLDRAREMFLENLPDDVRRVASPKETEALLIRVRALASDPRHRAVTGHDVKAAFAIFLLVVTSTLPPSIPFLLIDDVALAMRVMLFAVGARLGQYMGRSPWPMAFAMTAIGAVLVAVTILFGG
ncbi:VIT1/CCC1 transporter family protein [Ensifer sesbaniae]|uniref:VIT1/CCC1 transporter family protein n=1 Tax=Ensifer sesbaniae TaxID=1214071 RepID=UPI001569A9C3|nr:VIT1/CCC1 transporter family protein [Ensifer sesbaniae]NRQ15067.1 hypothetical protein [Ensifer sesbaniae]